MLSNALILVCALGTPQSECSMENAAAVLQGPAVSSPILCGLHGQAYLAATAIADYLEGGHYLKVRCTLGRPNRRGGADRIAISPRRPLPSISAGIEEQ